jgi:RNA-binding protein 39
MSFFIKEENVRAGNRGGRSLFNWNDIRLLNNKERESYLGVTQSIGFLDKGGKWRKRDWWQNNKNSNQEIDKNEILSEKERIKLEENRQFNDTLNNMFGNSCTNKTNKNIKKEKLTVFEWSELFKKEANINPNDPKVFEFYEKDEHRRGLGMKTNISFKTNPYERDTIENLVKIKGEGLEENFGENDINNEGKEDLCENDKEFDSSKNNRNISENNFNLKERKKVKVNYTLPELMEMWKSGKVDKNQLASFVLGENNANEDIRFIKKEKKEKKKKSTNEKSKKEKKNKRKKDKKDKKSKNKRSISISRSLSRSRSRLISKSRSRSSRSESESNSNFKSKSISNNSISISKSENSFDKYDKNHNKDSFHNRKRKRSHSYSSKKYSRSTSKDNYRNKQNNIKRESGKDKERKRENVRDRERDRDRDRDRSREKDKYRERSREKERDKKSRK